MRASFRLLVLTAELTILFLLPSHSANAAEGVSEISLGDLPMPLYDIADDSGCCIVMGNSNDDGNFDISDLVYMINYLFGGGPVPPCRKQADIYQDCVLDVQDVTIIIVFMFGGGFVPQECHYCPNWH